MRTIICTAVVGLILLQLGKYQLQVLPEAGHFIHEDQPRKTAMLVLDFYRRNVRSALVLPPKVSQMMKETKTANTRSITPGCEDGDTL